MTHQGEWHYLTLDTCEEETDTFNLDDHSDWTKLVSVIQSKGAMKYE